MQTIRLATQLTPEAQAGISATQQKMLGVNKEQLWVVFDALVNSQLPPHERISHSSVFKYLFCGLNYLGYQVEPLYGNESLHKTTRKGGGTKVSGDRSCFPADGDLPVEPPQFSCCSACLGSCGGTSTHLSLGRLSVRASNRSSRMV